MKFLFLILTVFIIGCESNPYPEVGTLREEPRAPRKDPADALSMVVQGKYEFKEGTLKSFRIKAVAPKPWKVDLQVKNLPVGATFDKNTHTVSWIPGFFDGNMPDDPSIKTRVYPITVWLRSTDPNSEVRTKEVNLIVFDVPQNMEIVGSDTEKVNEGKTLTSNFTIENKDYPQGPFSINTVDLPPNVEIVPNPIEPNKFSLKYSPDYDHVDIQNAVSCGRWNDSTCKVYKGKIRVLNPANHIAEKDFELKVSDIRLETKLVPPENMTQSLDTSFQVSAYDLNGEVAPRIELLSDEPEYGVFKVDEVRDSETKSSVLSISWNDIPPSYNGKTFRFDFSACSLDSRRRFSNCTRGTTRVTIVVKDRKPPVITRNSWANGKIQYLNHKETYRYNVEIVDGDNQRLDVQNVEVKPLEMQKYVSYRNGQLRVNFSEPGIHEFSLVATSEYRMTSAASFVAEVFEPNRSRTLYFTDSTRDTDKEVKFYRNNINSIQFMNPAIQVLNDRNLSGRDTLILGTSILEDLEMKTSITKAMEKIDNIIVASPLVEHMPDKFIDELQKDFHISIIGRYHELPNMPDLSEMRFVARDDFVQANDPVFLKQDSTKESYSPLIFSVGVDRVRCEDVLDLTNSKDEERLKVGIICDRRSGGRYAILGTEFSDLKTSEADAGIPEKWLRKMLSTKLDNR